MCRFFFFKFCRRVFMTSKNAICSDIRSLTVSFITGLFLYKVKLLAPRCAITIFASACHVTKEDKLFKMAHKMRSTKISTTTGQS